jgi:hypothetical protein
MRLSPRSQISGASRRRLALARWLAHQRHRARSGPGSACENRRQRTASAPAWVQWCRSVLAVLVHWLKMDAQKTYVLWLNRNTQEQAFSGRGARARQVAGHLSAEVRAVLATTDLPTRITRR